VVSGVERFESIVIGAGIVGSAAALHLAERGRTLVLEQFDVLHDRGSSHGGSRIFRHAYEDARYVRLAQAADVLWRALEERTGERLLLRTGGLDIGDADAPELEAIERALTESGCPVERLGAAQVAERFPAFRLAEGQVALYQAAAGILPATRCVATLLRAAVATGAALRTREAVVAVRAIGGGVEVETTSGRYAAARLVVTAGAWLGRVLAELALPLRIEQQQVLYVRPSDARPFAPDRMPVFIDRGTGVYGFPLFERPDAIKVSDHSGASAIELEGRDDRVDEARAASTIARSRTLMPALGDELVAAQTCLYTKTPDEHFILDRHPEHPQIVVGGGMSGHGFKFGPVLGEILADLASEGASRHDLSLFGLGRFPAGA
jgi:sarcosine oxidase